MSPLRHGIYGSLKTERVGEGHLSNYAHRECYSLGLYCFKRVKLLLFFVNVLRLKMDECSQVYHKNMSILWEQHTPIGQLRQ